MLKDLEADVETFRKEEKLEAAERLEQQVLLLKVIHCFILPLSTLFTLLADVTSPAVCCDTNCFLT